MSNEYLKGKFGSHGSVKFVNPGDVKTYDESGNEISIPVCKCGSAKSFISGERYSYFMCIHCSEKQTKVDNI